jgi:L-threonylcarbamoyladenylate synthase
MSPYNRITCYYYTDLAVKRQVSYTYDLPNFNCGSIMLMPLSSSSIIKAASVLNSGGVVVLPTDTVYGIAAHPNKPEGVARIFTIKGRPTGKPIALLASDPDAVVRFGAEFPSVAQKLAERYWPGALTLVLPCGETFEGFRVPAHEGACALLAACGGVLRVTSANLSGEMPALSAVSALKEVGLEADLVLDDGVSPGGVPSTVVKVTKEGVLTVLREGAISATEILACGG